MCALRRGCNRDCVCRVMQIDCVAYQSVVRLNSLTHGCKVYTPFFGSIENEIESIDRSIDRSVQVWLLIWVEKIGGDLGQYDTLEV